MQKLSEYPGSVYSVNLLLCQHPASLFFELILILVPISSAFRYLVPMNRNRWIGLILGVVLLLVAIDLLRQGQASFETTFVEILSYRNPNNTGPIQRIYVVSVSEENWDEMLQYGSRAPHSKYGMTTIHFFRENGLMPTEIKPVKPYFEASFEPQCIARYQKQAMGQETFEKYPFGEK